MAKFELELHQSGAKESFDFAGTREEYITQHFGAGGLNSTYGTLTEIDPIAVDTLPNAIAPDPDTKPKGGKKTEVAVGEVVADVSEVAVDTTSNAPDTNEVVTPEQLAAAELIPAAPEAPVTNE